MTAVWHSPKLYFLLALFKLWVPGLIYGSQALGLLFRYADVGRSFCHSYSDWEVGCDAQNIYLRDGWSAGFQASLLSGIPTGLMMQYLGPRKTGLAGIALAIMGLLTWSFMGESSSDRLLPIGWILIGLAKQPIANCPLGVEEIFLSSDRNRFISIINSFNHIGAVFPVLLFSVTGVLSFRVVLICSSILCAASAIIGWYILPPALFEIASNTPLISKATIKIEEKTRPPKTEDHPDDGRLPPPKTHHRQVRPTPAWQEITYPQSAQQEEDTRGLLIDHFFSVDNLFNLCFFGVSFWRLQFFDGNFTFRLASAYVGDPNTSVTYTLVFTLVVASSSFITVPLSMVTDRFGYHYQLLLINTAGLMMLITSLIPVSALQVCSLILFAVSSANLMGSLMWMCHSTDSKLKIFWNLLGCNTSAVGLICFVLTLLSRLLEAAGCSTRILTLIAIVLTTAIFAHPVRSVRNEKQQQRSEEWDVLSAKPDTV
eukprot:GHVN01027237.1.p1 GENE.GHVN01027237.1~~GHVN01027237.1.p1  ORF type:complete len:485 (-),score=50.28 GHVN01027237.1:309-1763(-)